jgi:prophage regulatory protein
MGDSVLRWPKVKARIPLSKSGVYLAISEGRFPRPIKLGGRAVGWLESEVDSWLRQQVEQSRGPGHKTPRAECRTKDASRYEVAL